MEIQRIINWRQGNKSPSVPVNSFAPKPKWNRLNWKTAVAFKGSCLKQDEATFNTKNWVNLFFVCWLDVWSIDLNTNFTNADCFFRAVKLSKNADLYKYGFNGHGIGFDARSQLSLSSDEWDRNLFSFGVGSSLLLHIDNRKKISQVFIKGKKWIRWYYNNRRGSIFC